jgi:hypothetical protein
MGNMASSGPHLHAIIHPMKQFLASAFAFGLAFHAPLWAEEPVVAPEPSEDVIPALEEPTAEGEVATTEDGSKVKIVIEDTKMDVVNGGGDVIVTEVVDGEVSVDEGIDIEVMEEGDPRIFYSSAGPEVQRSDTGSEGSAQPVVSMKLETLDDAQPQRVLGAKSALTPDNEVLRAMDVAKSSSKAQGFSVRTKLTATPGASKALKKDGKVFLK